MVNILRVGLLLVTFTLLNIVVNPAQADDEKKKRVIIKVPARIKHVYHHHTKKVHIHKKKPKTKPASIHVVHVEDEVKVKPIKTWKSIEWKNKGGGRSKKSKKHAYHGKGGGGGYDWKPRGFASSESLGSYEDFGNDASGTEEDSYIWGGDDDYSAGKGHGRWHKENYSGGRNKGKRGSVRGYKGKSQLRAIGSGYDYEEPFYDGSYVQEEKRRPMSKRPSPNYRDSGGKPSSHKYLPRENSYKRKPKHEDLYIGPEDYEENYNLEPVWPERKEHPSWHHRKQSKQWSPPGPKVIEDNSDDLPQYDNDETGYSFNNGFRPSASIANNQWAIPPLQPSPSPIPFHRETTSSAPIRQTPARNNRHLAGSGYHSKVASSPDGKSMGYQSHVGHSNDVNKPSSSYQSVRFGEAAKLNR